MSVTCMILRGVMFYDITHYFHFDFLIQNSPLGFPYLTMFTNICLVLAGLLHFQTYIHASRTVDVGISIFLVFHGMCSLPTD